MDRAMLERVANMAAREAVQQTFLSLGVDISTPGKVVEAQEMFSGMRNLQGELKVFKNRFWATIGSMAATLLGGVLYHYVTSFRAPPPI
jgi:hypothetical protein